MANLPPEFKIGRAQLLDEQSYVSSRSRSLRARQRKLTGQAWDFRLRSINLTATELKRVMATFSAVQRDNDVIVTEIPIYSQSGLNVATTGASLTRGQYQLPISTTSGLEVGDFFTFLNHSKAYQVTSVSGGIISFAPNVIVDVPNGTPMTFNGCKFTFLLSGRPQKYDITGSSLYSEVEVELIERF